MLDGFRRRMFDLWRVDDAIEQKGSHEQGRKMTHAQRLTAYEAVMTKGVPRQSKPQMTLMGEVVRPRRGLVSYVSTFPDSEKG